MIGVPADAHLLAGLVLAGGRARRMGRVSKAQLALPGGTMLEHVTRRLAPQVSALAIATGPGRRGDGLPPGLPGAPQQLDDPSADVRGPLAGLAAGLAWCDQLAGVDWLLLAPCDAPFLPIDLGERLLAAALDGDHRLALAVGAGHPQPTFSLWRHCLVDLVVEAFGDPRGPGLMSIADRVPHVRVEWPDSSPPPFFNVNTPADLARARDWLDRGAAEH